MADEQKQQIASGSGQCVGDYDPFTEGDEEPYLRKKIKTLIVKETNYIVYLDQDGAVEWACTAKYMKAPCVSDVLNRVSALEAIPLDVVPESAKHAFRRMLGEAVARVVSDQNEKSAHEILNQAESYVTGFRESVARKWHLQSTIVTTIPFVTGALAAWWQRDAVRRCAGEGVLELVLVSAAGAAGGFLSFAYRSRQVELDPSAGKGGYYFMGFARSLGAATGAVFVALAVKMKLVLGFLASASGNELTVLLLAAMAAGVSERLIPNLVRKVESSEEGKRS